MRGARRLGCVEERADRTSPVVNRTVLSATLLVVGLLSSASEGRDVARASTTKKLEVQGHRGARARFPENTLPAFRHAIAVGADVIELDVVVTKDDVLAVMHDPVVSEGLCTWTGEGAPISPFVVREHTFAELSSSFDCGKKNPKFKDQVPVPGTRVPSLDEVLALLAEPGAERLRANVEAKSVPARASESPPPDVFARLLVDAIAKNKMSRRASVQSFDHEVLRAVARIAPHIERSALVDQTRGDAVAIARAAKASVYSPHHEWITVDDVRSLHRAKIRVVPWTANLEDEWARLVAIGVDGIITDDPGALVAWRERPKN